MLLLLIDGLRLIELGGELLVGPLADGLLNESARIAVGRAGRALGLRLLPEWSV